MPLRWLRRLLGAGRQPGRTAAVLDVERALRRAGDGGRDRRSSARQRRAQRAQQLRRIAGLEAMLLDEGQRAELHGAPLLPAHADALRRSVDEAVDLARQRVLLLRAIAADPLSDAEEELAARRRMRLTVPARLALEADRLLTLTQERVARIRRWQDDLLLAELQLDQIEVVLRQLAYDPAAVQPDVSERLDGLRQAIAARAAAPARPAARAAPDLTAALERGGVAPDPR